MKKQWLVRVPHLTCKKKGRNPKGTRGKRKGFIGASPNRKQVAEFGGKRKRSMVAVALKTNWQQLASVLGLRRKLWMISN